jgi:hypothetical protein
MNLVTEDLLFISLVFFLLTVLILFLRLEAKHIKHNWLKKEENKNKNLGNHPQ